MNGTWGSLQNQEVGDAFVNVLCGTTERLGIERPQQHSHTEVLSYGSGYAEAFGGSMVVHFDVDREVGMHVDVQDLAYNQSEHYVLTNAEYHSRRAYDFIGIGAQFERQG